MVRKSPGRFSGAVSGVPGASGAAPVVTLGGRGVRRAALSFRAEFAGVWAEMLREVFDSPEAAAVAFGVDGTTARKWWEGLHAPSGAVVAMAFVRFPEAAQRLARACEAPALRSAGREAAA